MSSLVVGWKDTYVSVKRRAFGGF